MAERKLSKAEQARKEKFDALCQQMEKDGYKKSDLTISVAKANIYALFMGLPLAAVMGIIYYAINRGVHNFEVFWDLYIAVGILLVLTVVHELIHGITWASFAKSKFKSISFGIIWSALTPYCTCSEPLKKWQYILGAAMPTVILGVGLGFVAIFLDSFLLFVVTESMVFGGGGDMIIIAKLLKFKSKGKDVVFCDHPYECGVVAFEKQNRG